MTEIPEHLLKRSRERRSALGLGDDDAGSEAAGSTPAATPATTSGASTPAAPAASAPAGRAAAPAPATPPPAEPDSPVVAAYKSRRRIPFWAMAALSILPVWAFMYVRAVTEQPEEVAGPLGIGGDVYSVCASCHGGSGDGGVGYAFTGGEVLATFPNIEDQLRFVSYGTSGYNLAGVESYGDPNREGGPRIAGERGVMPAQQGTLTDAEILSVVCHERYALGGADPAGASAAEFEQWCSEASPLFAALDSGAATLATLHEIDDTIIPIGDGPAEGSPASE